MKREIKVCAKWQGKKFVPGINLQGLYLKQYGFEVNDMVRIEFSKDEIRIKKMSPEMILKTMTDQNPGLKKFIMELDCAFCD